MVKTGVAAGDMKAAVEAMAAGGGLSAVTTENEGGVGVPAAETTAAAEESDGAGKGKGSADDGEEGAVDKDEEEDDDSPPRELRLSARMSVRSACSSLGVSHHALVPVSNFIATVRSGKVENNKCEVTPPRRVVI